LAQAILELRLPLDAKIGELVPSLQPVYAHRTLAQLLNHSSGLDDYGMLPEYHRAVAAGETAWSREQLLERNMVLPHENSGFRYSNIGYLLLRMCLERQTGLTYFSSLKKLVLEPLGITGFREWEQPTDVVPGYDPRWVYSGTFLASPKEIAPGLAKLVTHRVQTLGLSAGWISVPHQNTGFDNPGYNYGFMGPGLPMTAAGHGGGGPGFGLMALVNPVTGKAGLRYATDGRFDQTAAILDLRAEIGLESPQDTSNEGGRLGNRSGVLFTGSASRGVLHR